MLDGIEITASKLSAPRSLADDLDSVVAYDAESVGAPRKTILENLMERSPRTALCLSGPDRGFVMSRSGRYAHQIGPLIANTTQGAEILLATALLATDPESVLLDIPDHQREFVDHVRALGFRPKRQFTRMYLGSEQVMGCPEKIYAVAGPDLG